MTESPTDNDPSKHRDMQLETLPFHVPGQQARQRIDAYLNSKVKYATRNRIQKAIAEGRIKINGKIVHKPAQNILPGDFIELTILRPASEEMIAEAMDLDILYEDEALIVVNKPAGIAVHPTYKHWSGTLANGLLHHFRETLGDPEAKIKPGLIHRLDKNTTGALVIGKSLEAKRILGKQFARREAKKIYQALVWGVPQQTQGIIETNLGPSPRDRRIQENFRYLGRQGKPARSAWKLLQRFERFSLLEIELFSGRTHQIRAHMKYLGHPILGDPVYGGQSGDGYSWSDKADWLPGLLEMMSRQALHAAILGFKHPDTGLWLEHRAPLPADFLSLTQWLSEQNWEP